jgi:hypothetical protein
LRGVVGYPARLVKPVYLLLCVLGGVVLGVAGVMGVNALTDRATAASGQPRARTQQAAAAAAEPAPEAAAPAPPEARLDHDHEHEHDAEPRYIVVGGGATPEYTEVSLEQDTRLATQSLPGPGLTLFAGGQGSVSVRLLAPPVRNESLLAQLGAIFDPRPNRDSRYRATTLNAQPATLTNFETSMALAMSTTKEPLLVYIAMHGLQGSEARDNYFELWGGDSVTVAQLDELTAGAKRPVRFVIASCYSGGFAELAFTHAEAQRGPTTQQRCGLFAGTWDRQTSGCDPNPDRRAQEGYSLHMLHALRGEDRAGKALPRNQLDLDGDGKISLLEAHTRARIASTSIDVPTTTSERYLREVVKTPAPPQWKLLPEDAAVVKQLGARLGLLDAAAVDKRYQELSAKLDELQPELDAADEEQDHARSQLGAELLARWPVLGDSFHDEFASALERDSAAISGVLRDSRYAQRFKEARTQADALGSRANTLDAQEAVVLRLVRAYETAGLASALAARGGEDYARYQALLACERGVP